MGWIGCVGCKKIPTWLRGTYFCINSTSSHCFAKKSLRDFVARTFALIAPVHTVLHWVSCSYETIIKCTQTLWNLRKHEFRVQWGGSSVHCEKSRRDFVAQTFALIAPVHPVLHRVSCSYEMIPNAPKHYEMQQHMSSGSNGVDWVHLLWKNPDMTSWHELLR